MLLSDDAVVGGMMGALPRPPQSEHFPMPPVGMMPVPVSMATAGPAAPDETKKTSSFDRIVEKLSPLYPNHTRQAAVLVNSFSCVRYTRDLLLSPQGGFPCTDA